MCRPRAPPTNAAVFAEMDDGMRGALGDPSSVYIGSVDRFGSVTESRRQDQIRLDYFKTWGLFCVSEKVSNVLIQH